jgi:hypothetical protein
MDGAREEFLAGARFTEQQDRKRRLRPSFHVAEDPEKSGILCDDAQPAAFLPQLLMLGVAQGTQLSRRRAETMELPL